MQTKPMWVLSIATVALLAFTALPEGVPLAGAVVSPDAVVGTCSFVGTPSEVSIVNFAFDPDLTEISPGTLVMWTNDGTVAHTSTSDDMVGLILQHPLWDSGQIQPGNPFRVLFCDEGTFDYHCENHPNLMRATIEVA
jgi:plastocyanin